MACNESCENLLFESHTYTTIAEAQATVKRCVTTACPAARIERGNIDECVPSCTDEAQFINDSTRFCQADCSLYKREGANRVCISSCSDFLYTETDTLTECIPDCTARGMREFIGSQNKCVDFCGSNYYLTITVEGKMQCDTGCTSNLHLQRENEKVCTTLEQCIGNYSFVVFVDGSFCGLRPSDSCEYAEETTDNTLTYYHCGPCTNFWTTSALGKVCIDECPVYFSGKECVSSCPKYIEDKECVNECTGEKVLNGQICKDTCDGGLFNNN